MFSGEGPLWERNASAKEELKNLEVFCPREECGDPVADRSGRVAYTKRRMNFVGFGGLLERAVYKCPVCGRERKYARHWLTDQIREV